MSDDEDATRRAAEFIRERRARRYNRQANALLDAWVHLVTGGHDVAELAAFGLAEADGMDAHFRVARTTAFSRRLSRAGGSRG